MCISKFETFAVEFGVLTWMCVFQMEQLIKDENVCAMFELIDNFCEFILTRFSYIRKHKYDSDKTDNDLFGFLFLTMIFYFSDLLLIGTVQTTSMMHFRV